MAKFQPFTPHSDNLSRDERKAIKEFKANPHIVIKKADKGSSIVIQNTVDYIMEAKKQLSNKDHYRNVECNLTDTHNHKVQGVLNDMLNSNSISSKLYNYLYIKEPRVPSLYLLPKIHKGIIPPPGRPILSANECPTERISAFVDFFLKPLVKEIPSYIKDTTDFINKIEEIGRASCRERV